jgi:hypothetical protein
LINGTPRRTPTLTGELEFRIVALILASFFCAGDLAPASRLASHLKPCTLVCVHACALSIRANATDRNKGATPQTRKPLTEELLVGLSTTAENQVHWANTFAVRFRLGSPPIRLSHRHAPWLHLFSTNRCCFWLVFGCTVSAARHH